MKKCFRSIWFIAVLFIVARSVSGQNLLDARNGLLNESGKIATLPRGDSVMVMSDIPSELDSMYIIQFDRLPLYRVESKKSGSIPQSQKKVNNLQDDLTLLNVQHKKFLSDLILIEKKLGLTTESKDSLYSQIIAHYILALNGVALKTSPLVIPKIRELSYVTRIEQDVTTEAFDDRSNEILEVLPVWKETGATGKGILIGFLDTGIDPSHPDLGDRVHAGYDFVNSDEDAMDDQGHGTHCAGVAAANGTDLMGVAPDAELIPLKVLNSSGKGYGSWLIAGIEFALDPDGDPLSRDELDVLNISLGARGNPDDFLSQAIDNAVNMGVICVVAAGNEGPEYSSVASPGCARDALTVGASDLEDQIASFSSRGPAKKTGGIKPEIVAPGVQVNSSLPGNLYSTGNGTSIAAAHIAGAAALLLELHPDWGPQEIKSALVSTATDLGKDILTQGGGRADLYKATAAHISVDQPLINFGEDDQSQESWSATRVITLKNTTEKPAVYALSEGTVLPEGIHLEFPESVSLNAMDSTKIEIILHVDNLVSKAPELPYIYEGKLILQSVEDRYQVPWACSRAARLEITFDRSPTFLEITGPTELRVCEYNPGTFYSTILEPGTYDVIAIFDWGERIVAKEALELGNRTVHLTMNATDAIYAITFGGVDPSGAPLALTDYGIQRLSHKGMDGDLFNLFNAAAYRDTVYTPVTRFFSRLSEDYIYEISPVSFPRMNPSEEYYSIPWALTDGIADSMELVNSPDDFIEVEYAMPLREDDPLLLTWGNVSDEFTVYHEFDWYKPEANLIRAPYSCSRYLIPQPISNYSINQYYTDRISKYRDNTLLFDSTVLIPPIYNLPYGGESLGITRRMPDPFSGAELTNTISCEVEIPIVGGKARIPMGLSPPHFSGEIAFTPDNVILKTEHPYFSNPYYDVSCGSVQYKLSSNESLIRQGMVRNDFEWLPDEVSLAVDAEKNYDLELSFTQYSIQERTGKAVLDYNFSTESGKPILLSSFKNLLIYANDSLTNDLHSSTSGNKIVYVFTENNMIRSSLSIRNMDTDRWITINGMQEGDQYIAMLPEVLTSGYYALKIEAENQYHDKLVYTLEPAFHFTSHTTNKVENLRNDELYITIREAIDRAGSGDTLLVYPGVYRENIDFRGKNLTVTSLYMFSEDTSHISGTVIMGDSVNILVRFAHHEDTTALLKGFTLTRGLGALFCDYTSPTLEDLRITGNFSGDYPRAAAAYFSGSHSTLRNIYIARNETHPDLIIGWTNGIYLRNSHLDITNLILYQNSLRSDPERAGNSGLILLDDEGTRINGLQIMDSYNRVLHLVNSKEVSIINTLIAGNISNESTGSLISLGSGSSLKLTNATITNNQEYSDEGFIHIGDGCRLDINNSIIRNNRNDHIVFKDALTDSSILAVSYSDIEGGQGFIVRTDLCDVRWLEGNIDADPLFVDIEEGNYQLSKESPCIGAGNPEFIPGLDISGNTRPSPAATLPDMGALEEQLITPEDGNAEKALPVVTMYPNPAATTTGYVTLCTDGEDMKSIRIYDYTAHKIFEMDQINDSYIRIALDNLSEGILFVQIYLESTILVQKLLINK